MDWRTQCRAGMALLSGKKNAIQMSASKKLLRKISYPAIAERMEGRNPKWLTGNKTTKAKLTVTGKKVQECRCKTESAHIPPTGFHCTETGDDWHVSTVNIYQMRGIHAWARTHNKEGKSNLSTCSISVHPQYWTNICKHFWSQKIIKDMKSCTYTQELPTLNLIYYNYLAG